MMPLATPFFFYLLAGVAVISALLCVTKINPVHSALALIMVLLASAGLYLMLYAPFMAGVQIVLYAGGIVVMFLFVMMLVNLEQLYTEKMLNRQWLLALAGAAAVGYFFVRAILSGAATLPKVLPKLAEESNTQQLGLLLYQDYMFAFEVASLLLLVAIVGAVVMAKRRV